MKWLFTKVEWYADETGYHPSAPFLPKNVVPNHPGDFFSLILDLDAGDLSIFVFLLQRLQPQLKPSFGSPRRRRRRLRPSTRSTFSQRMMVWLAMGLKRTCCSQAMATRGRPWSPTAQAIGDSRITNVWHFWDHSNNLGQFWASHCFGFLCLLQSWKALFSLRLVFFSHLLFIQCSYIHSYSG